MILANCGFYLFCLRCSSVVNHKECGEKLVSLLEGIALLVLSFHN
jgi:hypothetical protein